MNKYCIATFLSLVSLLFSNFTKADISSSFVVYGDVDKYYPITFLDFNWDNNRSSTLELGRSNVHTDAGIRGAVIAKFEYHTNNYGHGASFINASIYKNNWIPNSPMIAGWVDATNYNGDKRIVIWLKGGTTTYYFKAEFDAQPIVYDNVQNALPFTESGGPLHTFKTSVEPYVNNNGVSLGGDMIVNGGVLIGGIAKIKSPNFPYPLIGTRNPLYLDAENFGSSNSSAIVFSKGNTAVAAIGTDIFTNAGKDIYAIAGDGNANILFNPYVGTGNVGIGTLTPTERLSVNGNIRTRKVIVTQTGWPDYVFDSSYQLPSLDSVSSFIQVNKHLPDIPSAATVEKDGHDLGEVQKQLLKKVEELTLYMIELKKENLLIKNENKEMREEIRKIKNDK